MVTLQGTGVSAGVAHGTLYCYQRPATGIERRVGENVEKEKLRIDEARQKAAAQLAALADICRTKGGAETTALFEMHAMLLTDEDYVAAIEDTLSVQQCNAEYAVLTAGEQFAGMLAALDDPYMRERAADIRDVTSRLINNLTGFTEGEICSDEPVILVADDLAPSETIRLDKSKILGFALRKGSTNSHTAILARTLGIPAVCGLGDALASEWNDQQAYLDGETGQLVMAPDAAALADFTEKAGRQRRIKELALAMRGKEDVTQDGRHVHIYCNIGSIDDLKAVHTNDGQGIGLFRSEFLYLAASDYPSEETQFQAYRAAATAMEGKRVIIRTLDIGADKQADYFHLDKEDNPAMGLRAIRICLSRPEIFRTQLRALYRASAFGKIAIMFPMITSVWEVQACRRACESVMEELAAEGIPFAPDAEIGIMIETPASVFIARELAALVDFFSVGTNDLTQYTLACDRQCTHLERFSDPHHPAVLRALRQAADAAHEAGIWIGVCGELAADMTMLPTFLALGIDELSVSPAAVLPLRAALRQSVAATCGLDLLDC